MSSHNFGAGQEQSNQQVNEKLNILKMAYENPFEMFFQEKDNTENEFKGIDLNLMSPHSGGKSGFKSDVISNHIGSRKSRNRED